MATDFINRVLDDALRLNKTLLEQAIDLDRDVGTDHTLRFETRCADIECALKNLHKLEE